MAYTRANTQRATSATIAQQNSPPAGNFLDTLIQDIINFFAQIFGRTVTTPQSTPVTVANSPKSTGVVVPPIAKIPKPTISASQAIAQAIATETKLNPRDFAGSGWYQASNLAFQQETIQGQIVFGWNPNVTCGGPTAPGLTLQQASSAALGGSSIAVGALSHAGIIGAGLSSTLGIVTAGAGLVVGIIIAIFQHHAQAVARDNRAECQLIPAVNNSFDVIINGVKNGQIQPGDAVQALQAIPATYLQIAGAAKNNSPYCNALCEYLIRVRAIVFYWTSQFQSME